MDGISSKIEFAFWNLQSHVSDPNEIWQLLLRIESDFSIRINDEIVYSETMFPLVEFAAQAAVWLNSGKDFLYISMESEDEPLLGFYSLENGVFKFYNCHSSDSGDLLINYDSLSRAIERFICDIKAKIKCDLKIDIRKVFSLPS